MAKEVIAITRNHNRRGNRWQGRFSLCRRQSAGERREQMSKTCGTAINFAPARQTDTKSERTIAGCLIELFVFLSKLCCDINIRLCTRAFEEWY